MKYDGMERLFQITVKMIVDSLEKNLRRLSDVLLFTHSPVRKRHIIFYMLSYVRICGIERKSERSSITDHCNGSLA